MQTRPTGTITFLFTDIEGSTALWEQHPGEMALALARHDDLLLAAVRDSRGFVVKTTGDGMVAAFHIATDALRAALLVQQALQAEAWSELVPIKVRMGLHTGAADLRNGDYFGPTLNRAARLMAAGHGGQVLLSEVTQNLCRDALPPGASLRHLGLHRLKDLAHPETIHQLDHADLQDNFLPLRFLNDPDRQSNNLPQQLTSFIGREKEILDVCSLLEKSRLVTLTGAGGSGKTRLSLQVADDVLDENADGVCLIEYALITDPSLVAQTLASALKIAERTDQSVEQTLIDRLKSKQILLLMDNCEHVVNACAKLIDAVLRFCPQVRVLATSREPIGVWSEAVYLVPQLSLPDARSESSLTAANLNEYEAIRLFAERAKSANARFSVTDENAACLVQLCQRLDGIPLAIELAAARTRSLSAEEINSRLDSRFSLLTQGDRSAMPRHQTLRALVDWSYDLLSQQEKMLFGRLSVFIGGWTLKAAESVCTFGPIENWAVIDLLTNLSDKSLVVTEQSNGTMRYRMLESLRQYGSEKSEDFGEAQELQRRHRDWCVALAEDVEPRLRGPDQVAWLDLLETEHDNFRAALNYHSFAAIESVDDAGVRLAGALSRFWYVRGYLTEGQDQLKRATGTARERGTIRSSVGARALAGLGALAYGQDDYSAARTLFEESLSINRELGDRGGVGHSLSSLGNIAFCEGDMAVARVLHEENLEIFRELGDRDGIGDALRTLGRIAHSQGDLETARAWHEQSLVIVRESGDKGGTADSLRNIGRIAYNQGDTAIARTMFEESLSIVRVLGDKRGTANVLRKLGDIARDEGDLVTARLQFEESLGIFRELGDRRGVAYSLISLGSAAQDQGKLMPARAMYDESLGVLRGLADKSGIALVLRHMGRVVQHQGDLPEARRLYQESIAIRRELVHKEGLAYSMEGLASVFQSEKAHRRAVVLRGATSALRDDINAQLPSIDEAAQNEEIAEAQIALGKTEFAAAWNQGRTLTWEQAASYALVETKLDADDPRICE